MKIPKSLIHSILVGITAGSMLACSEDTVEPTDVRTCGNENCQHVGECPDGEPVHPYNCPACGLG